MEFTLVRGSGREDMLFLKAKGTRVGCLQIEGRTKPVAGKLAAYLVQTAAGASLNVKAIAPSSSSEGMELWLHLEPNHSVVLKRIY
jgi:hypothetical protein